MGKEGKEGKEGGKEGDKERKGKGEGDRGTNEDAMEGNRKNVMKNKRSESERRIKVKKEWRKRSKK